MEVTKLAHLISGHTLVIKSTPTTFLAKFYLKFPNGSGTKWVKSPMTDF